MATIIELHVENFKRIKALQIVPSDNTVVLSGQNDSGKTSTLDAIASAFMGEREICEEPLRHGQKSGKVRIKLSEELNNVCIIERRFNPSGTVLEIRNADGVPQKSPQALLDAVIGEIGFDPLTFVRLKKEPQTKLLAELVGLDFTEVNAVKAQMYQERTIRNRELEAAKAKLNAHQFNPSLPKEPLDISKLALQLGEAKQKNSSVRQRKQAVEAQKQKSFDLSEDVKALTSKVESLKKMLQESAAQLEQKIKAQQEAVIESERMEKEIAALQLIDETVVQKQIDEIQQTNAGVEQNKLYTAAQDNVALLEGTVKALTAKIKECDDQKAAQIEFAQFPMPELGFDEERGVLLNNVPFAQGSQARQLQASIAIGIALNPKVRVILIRDGSLLDEKSLAAVKETCAASKTQLWVECVQSKDPSAIVIEDGEVKGA